MNEELQVCLETLGSGAAAELFNDELGKVLSNIVDVNTDHKTAREVSLKVTIRPNEDRTFGAVTIAASSKLAPVKSVGTAFFIGRKAGRAVATERDSRQLTFDSGNVVGMKEAANG